MKDVRVNYIVCFYNGVRKCYPQGTPIDYFLDQQIKFLSKPINHIKGFTFVFNKSGNDGEIIEKATAFCRDSNLEGKLIVRPNIDGSYGAWEQGIMETYQNFTHSFLVEDDYIPVCGDFLDYFLGEGDGNTAFVASWVGRSPINPKTPVASISNGLFFNKVIPETLKKHATLFRLVRKRGNAYPPLGRNQRRFLNFITNGKDGKLKDITNVASTVYQRSNKQLEFYKDPKLPTIMKPIVSFEKFSLELELELELGH